MPVFFFPPQWWAIPLALAAGFLLWLLVRHAGAAIFMGGMLMFNLWIYYDTLLHWRIESWLSSQRAYQILFADFPQDKDHYIYDFIEGYRSGDTTLAAKAEEEKIIMMVHHVKHYVENAPDEVIGKHIRAEANLLAALLKTDRGLCQRYLGYSGHFADVWRTVGSDIFLESIRYNPEMIVEGHDHPQPVSAEDRIRARAVYLELMNSMRAAGAKMDTDDHGVLPCATVAQEFDMLTRLPPHDAALAIKFSYGEGHLQNQPTSGLDLFLLPLLR